MIILTTTNDQEIADFRDFLARVPALRREMEKMLKEMRDIIAGLEKLIEKQNDPKLREIMGQSLLRDIQLAEYMEVCLPKEQP